MKLFHFVKFVLPSLLCLPACGQVEQSIGGPCEGCEAIYESSIAFEKLPAADTMPGFNADGIKIFISGKLLKADGKTPAANVIVYLHQTNAAGIYATIGNEKGWGKRHGYMRNWLKTDVNGNYAFCTIRPGSYPNSNNPQHIHITIKEPGKKEYWIDEFLFDDDPLLTKEARQNLQNRGGSGIIHLQKEGSILKGSRTIIAGKNIPGYY
ncbi:MAG TPA: hypothetical protein PK504_05260 [Ferruginibacter sp.]|nr:hypothetical protein [Ferruginibacter sp.]HRE62536.1 hypothetical protein [Ferruginibacter sp.]